MVTADGWVTQTTKFTKTTSGLWSSSLVIFVQAPVGRDGYGII